MGRRTFKILIAILAVITLVSFLGGSAFWTVLGTVDDLAIHGRAGVVNDRPEFEGSGWSAYGGDEKGTRYSSATQISRENVEKLSIAWTYKTGALYGRDKVRDRTAFEATPILIDDKLIFCTQFNEVIAIDPENGTEIWRYDPKVPLDSRPANQYTCRGVSYWHDGEADAEAFCASRLFMGTVDARLIALDAKTGMPCSSFATEGEVQLEPSLQLRWPGEFQITSAPAIYKNIIITGSAIGDNLRTNAPLGTVHAFDARTGTRKWSFNPVPQDPADPASQSWAGASAQRTGHANVRSTISVDSERGLVFLPTSSPSPDYYGGNRVGDNRYANSVVALDAESGVVTWHFQTVHHDLWDYDVPSQPGLYQVVRDGQVHDVVVQVTKTGFVFVLDRETGAPFLPIREQAVPQDAVDGEVLSLTQPFPVITPPIVRNKLDHSDAFGVTLWDKLICANRIKALRHDGLYTPPSLEGTLADAYFGRAETILKRRERIKRNTIKQRRLQHQQQAA